MIITALEMAGLVRDYSAEYDTPAAYLKFEVAPATDQYMVWIEIGSGSVGADGTVLKNIGVFAIEYYSKKTRDFAGEARLEQWLTDQGLFWQRISSAYIQSEKTHVTIYNV